MRWFLEMLGLDGRDVVDQARICSLFVVCR